MSQSDFWIQTPALLTLIGVAFPPISQIALIRSYKEQTDIITPQLLLRINRSHARQLKDPTIVFELDPPHGTEHLDFLFKIAPSFVTVGLSFFSKHINTLVPTDLLELPLSGQMQDSRMPTFEPNFQTVEHCVQILMQNPMPSQVVEDFCIWIQQHQELYHDLQQPYLTLVEQLYSQYESSILLGATELPCTKSTKQNSEISIKKSKML